MAIGIVDKRISMWTLLFVPQPKGVIIKFCCLNRYCNTKCRETRKIHLFILDSVLYPLYLHTAASSVVVQFYSVTRMFHRNLYDIKHTQCYWGTWLKPQHIWISSITGHIILRFNCILEIRASFHLLNADYCYVCVLTYTCTVHFHYYLQFYLILFVISG
jgi:hypothetical protein